jgi:uncharacterized protein
MEHITRTLSAIIPTRLHKNKAIIIIGPRQVGKTTLMESFIGTQTNKVLKYNCDDESSKNFFETANINILQSAFANVQTVVIDEAQRVKNIGLVLKLITDRIKHVQLIITGSSALELANEVNEPLTGRKFEYYMLPLSCKELTAHHGSVVEKDLLPNRLVYGSYPDVINNPGLEAEILRNLAGSYLYKDILAWQEIRRPELLEKILKALALQMGSEVSYNELAQTAGCDSATINRYIQLLEKAFVIFRLSSFSRNVRNELKKSQKIYFFDNGIRNAIIGNYLDINNRNDIGALWENYLITERYKLRMYEPLLIGKYFWRTTQQQEIDYIEESNGATNAYEFKWNAKSKTTLPLTFTKAYPNSTFQVISKENYMDFICT